MPLVHGYCVVIGTLHHYNRDPINDYGQYYHDNIYLTTPEGQYHCAVDVDSKQTNDGINWRVVSISASEMKGVAEMTNGRHDLPFHNQAGAPTGGAIDNIRTAGFHRPGCVAVFVRYDPLFELLRRIFNAIVNPPWSGGDSKAALDVLEPLLDQSQRLFVFGEPFHYGGLGVHNIHQNQGDPANSQWWAENGIWQDGGTIIQKTDGSYVAYLTKFKTQATNTDANGHPV
jgi:hypothetical protein